MNTRTLLAKLGRLYPKRLAHKYFDPVGFMAGQKIKEVNKIVVVLDLDEIIIEQVLSHNPDLILTHHPFIYGTRFRVFKRDLSKKALTERLDALPLMVYSIHTNFDEAPGGMNDALIARLGIKDGVPLVGAPMARGGTLPEPMAIELFAKHAVNVLDAGHGQLVAGGTQIIKSVAIIGGGGSRSWSVAQDEGYDIYISGDAPHYVRRDIMNAKYNYLDLPHEIENIFMATIKEALLSIDPTLEVITITHELPPTLIK